MRQLLPLLAAGSLALSGCVAGLAASAAGMAVREAQGEPQSNGHLKPAARKTCAAYAAQYGAVHIIDVEQRRAHRLIVWGTVTDSAQRRSFECHFTTALADFKLRAIRNAD